MSLFHDEHGRCVVISEDSKSAWKRTFIGSNWVYSKRDVKENEIICVRLSAVSEKSNGRRFVVGFTDENPDEMPIRPDKNSHLCHAPMFLHEADVKQGAMVILMYNVTERLVYLGVNGLLRGVTTLWGLADGERWLAVKIDGKIVEVQTYESPDNQWNSFVFETARVAKLFKNSIHYNSGAPGVPKPLLTFNTEVQNFGVNFSPDFRRAIIEGCMKSAAGSVLYTARPVLLNELVQLRVSRVEYGTVLEVFTLHEDPKISYGAKRHPLRIPINHDLVVNLVCTETGLLIQGRNGYVQTSTPFIPISPAWLGIRIQTPASFITLEFDDPHNLPHKSSLRANNRIDTKLAQSDNTLSCKICYDSQMDTVLTPCHHVSMCSECTRKVMERTDWKCPICGQVVEGFFKVKPV